MHVNVSLMTNVINISIEPCFPSKDKAKEPREEKVRIKEEPRDTTPRSKHGDRDDQQVAPPHHDDSRRSFGRHGGHSSDEEERDEIVTAGHGHRRSAEPSPKHIDERGLCLHAISLYNSMFFHGYIKKVVISCRLTAMTLRSCKKQ